MDTITISIKLPGQPVETVDGLSSFVMIGIPKEDPSTNTKFMASGVSPKAIAECGAWLITLAKHMQDDNMRGLPPLGRHMTDAQQRVVKPTAHGRTVKTDSGLIIP